MTRTGAAPIRAGHWGRVAYRPALDRQLDEWERVRDGGTELLVTLEHDPVYTLGKRADQSDVLISAQERERRGVTVVRIDRGGEVTYHGPGQLVVYAIVEIKRHGLGVGDLVRGIAGGVADVLAGYDIDAEYDTERPGLWVGGAKIAAVGMRVARGVSRHGAALNVTTDLSYFDAIVPCGLPSAATTRLADIVDEPPSLDALGMRVREAVAARFSWELIDDDRPPPAA